MRNAQETNRKTDVIVSAPVLTQRQTHLFHTINNKIIIIIKNQIAKGNNHQNM